MTAEEHASDAMRGLSLPVVRCDREGLLVDANGAWSDLVGEHEAVVPWDWLGVVFEEDRERLRRAILGAVQSGASEQTEFRVHTPGGASRYLLCSVDPTGGTQPEGAICICFDVSERRRSEEQLAFMAGHDPLTGLLNRRSFEEGLARAVARAERGARAALLMVDMDNLKSFNDTRGHLEGDQALVNFSLLLRRHVRASDLVARIGGDEFAVLLEDATLSTALDIAERMRETAAVEEFVAGAREHELGLSAGVTTVDAHVDPRMLVDRADAALYAAKQAGRNRVVAWTPGSEDVAQPDRLAGLVRDAITHKRLDVAWQPVVRLTDGSPTYYESLVRLPLPDGEVLHPGDFLPVAERLGLMARLTVQVVRRVLSTLAAHPRAVCSVNLSASDLGDADLLEEVFLLVRASGIEPQRLVLETSEAALLSSLGGGRQWIERFVPRGHRAVLDEFGTGLGTFLLLREPGIDQVKLSSAVTRALADDERALAFIIALRQLIESQGKSVVASCLEDGEIVRAVMGAGFTLGQGFGLCEPCTDMARLLDMAPLHPVAAPETA